MSLFFLVPHTLLPANSQKGLWGGLWWTTHIYLCFKCILMYSPVLFFFNLHEHNKITGWLFRRTKVTCILLHLNLQFSACIPSSLQVFSLLRSWVFEKVQEFTAGKTCLLMLVKVLIYPWRCLEDDSRRLLMFSLQRFTSSS